VARRPWDRESGENEEAWAAFLAYRDMGPSRTLEGVGKLLDKSWRLCGRWSSRWKWIARCEAWDSHLQRERDKVAAREAAKWERRRQAELERVWDVSDLAEAKLRQMLAFPLATTRTRRDGKTVIVRPVRWAMRDAIAGLKLIAEMKAAVLAAVTKDAGQLSDAEARAIAGEPGAGGDPAT
jgi:hypothetical protein